MSGSENMIERVARAICASDFDGDVSVYDTMSEAMRENFTINARAAIEAMMEPTPEQVKAMMGGISGYPREEAVRAIYQAALRSSLTGDSK